jgi:hypothetical protein
MLSVRVAGHRGDWAGAMRRRGPSASDGARQAWEAWAWLPAGAIQRLDAVPNLSCSAQGRLT